MSKTTKKGARKGIGKSAVPKRLYETKRRFSLVSDEEESSSSLSGLSEDGDNFYSAPVFESSSENESIEGWNSAVEYEAIMGPSSDDSSGDQASSSSSDDSDVDFVKLTAERKAKAIKAAKLVGKSDHLPKEPKAIVKRSPGSIEKRKNMMKTGLSDSESEDPADSDLDKSAERIDVDKKGSPKKGKERAKIGGKGEKGEKSLEKDLGEDLGEDLEEEDLGEVVHGIHFQDGEILPSYHDHFFMDVPRFAEDEFNSDDEFDDSKLIATLQNDNEELELQAFGQSDDELPGITSADDSILRQEENALTRDLANRSEEEEDSMEWFDDEESVDFSLLDDPFDKPQSKMQDGFILGPYKGHNDLSGQNSYTGPHNDGYHYSEESEPLSDEEPQGLKGDSTDEDNSLPTSSVKKIGSKRAKEVLSLSKIDPRPPVLGTWATSEESKPFGIIDGLSTRTLFLVKNPSDKSNMQQFHPEQPLALDELLNTSEFEQGDEGDNSEKWAFLTTGNPKNVPLSAFRNKGINHDPDHHLQNIRKFSFRSHGSRRVDGRKARRKSSRRRKEERPIVRRRQSMVEAKTGGLRPTKNGLFSENTLDDVHEFLLEIGEVDDFDIILGL